MDFTGERYIPEMDSPEISYEHWHRYFFASQFVRGKLVLDIASGEGYGSYLLAQSAQRVVGVDISDEAVAHATSKYIRDNLEYRIGTAADIPIEGRSLIDAVISFETIEHLAEEHHKVFLAEVKRLLTPVGVFIVSTPNKLTYSEIQACRNEFHMKEYYIDEFRQFLSTEFRYVSLFGQRIYGVSYIWPEDLQKGGLEEYRVALTDKGFRATDDPKSVYYILAICSNERMQVDKASILLDLSNRIITVRDEHIRLLNQLIADKERMMQAVSAQLTGKEHELVALQSRSMEVETQLQVLRSGSAFHLLSQYRRLIDRFLIPGTSRRRLFDRVMGGVRILVTQGPKSSWDRMKNR